MLGDAALEGDRPHFVGLRLEGRMACADRSWLRDCGRTLERVVPMEARCALRPDVNPAKPMSERSA